MGEYHFSNFHERRWIKKEWILPGLVAGRRRSIAGRAMVSMTKEAFELAGTTPEGWRYASR